MVQANRHVLVQGLQKSLKLFCGVLGILVRFTEGQTRSIVSNCILEVLGLKVVVTLFLVLGDGGNDFFDAHGKSFGFSITDCEELDLEDEGSIGGNRRW